MALTAVWKHVENLKRLFHVTRSISMYIDKQNALKTIRRTAAINLEIPVLIRSLKSSNVELGKTWMVDSLSSVA